MTTAFQADAFQTVDLAFQIDVEVSAVVARGKTGPRSGDKPFKGTYPWTEVGRPTPQQSWARGYWRGLKAQEEAKLKELAEAKRAAEAVQAATQSQKRVEKTKLEALDSVLSRLELEAEQSFASMRKARADALEKQLQATLREIESLMVARQEMQAEIELNLARLKDEDDAVATLLLTLH